MSRIEGSILAVVWLLTVAASVHAISNPPPPPVAWLPVAHKYQGGDYVGSVALEPVRAAHPCAVVVVTELNNGFSRIYYRNDIWHRDPAYHGKVKVSLCAGDTAVRMDFDADTLPAAVPVRFREGRVYCGDVEAAP